MYGLLNALIKDFLGKYGRMLLDFVMTHSMIISAVVIGYGLILVIAQNNLDKIAKKAYELGKDALFMDKAPAVVLAAKEADFWEALRTESTFPFIAHQTSLFLYRLTPANMNKMLTRLIIYKQRNDRNRKKKK